MKFKIEEVAIDAIYNVCVNGYYNDGVIMIGNRVAFQFDLETTPHSTAAEFLSAVKSRVEASQPVISEEEEAEKALAEQAKALLDGYVGDNITLNPPI